jgi:hypothetical protein
MILNPSGSTAVKLATVEKEWFSLSTAVLTDPPIHSQTSRKLRWRKVLLLLDHLLPLLRPLVQLPAQRLPVVKSTLLSSEGRPGLFTLRLTSPLSQVTLSCSNSSRKTTQ